MFGFFPLVCESHPIAITRIPTSAFQLQFHFQIIGARWMKRRQDEVDKILQYFGVDKIVIGHTLVSQIRSDDAGKVIKLDVKHGHQKSSSNTQGLLVMQNQEFLLDAAGKREPLK
jgi:hypothetical protein